jgi:hypothetical protein
MKRRLLLTMFGLVLATIAWADVPAPRPADEVRLHENIDLIKNLVKGSLLLAGEDDPLKRADHCNALATYVAGEMEQAAEKHDGDRAAELGEYLRALLEQGVAGNLRAMPGNSPTGSARDQEVSRLGQDIHQVLDMLESHLRHSGENDEAINRALQEVRSGKAEVEQALKSRMRKK